MHDNARSDSQLADERHSSGEPLLWLAERVSGCGEKTFHDGVEMIDAASELNVSGGRTPGQFAAHYSGSFNCRDADGWNRKAEPGANQSQHREPLGRFLHN